MKKYKQNVSKIVTSVVLASIGFSPALVVLAHGTDIEHRNENVQEKRIELRNASNNVKTELQEKRVMLKDEAMQKREDLKMNIEVRRDAIRVLPKEDAKARRMELREDIAVRRDELRSDIKEKRDAFHLEAEERRSALKERVGEERAKRIEEFFARMLRRFEAAIDRLTKLADRIDSHLNKLEDNGRDVGDWQDMLLGARDKIVEAEIALDEAKQAFEDMTLNENPKEAFSKVKELARGVVVKIKDAHKALVEVIRVIKGSKDGGTSDDQ